MNTLVHNSLRGTQLEAQISEDVPPIVKENNGEDFDWRLAVKTVKRRSLENIYIVESVGIGSILMRDGTNENDPHDSGLSIWKWLCWMK